MATTIPQVDYKQLATQGETSYIDPITGKTVYMTRIDPNKETTLRPMDLVKNPPPILTPQPASGGIDDLVQKLIQSMAPSAQGAAATPLTYDLPGIYKGATESAQQYGEQYFQDLIGRIGAPSSVDEISKGLENEQVKQLLDEIDRTTKGTVATTKLDALDRGVGGPGQYGDIEANALAQVRTGGDRTKAGVRLSAYQSELARQKAREEAVNSAYGTRYQVGAASDVQNKNLIAQLLGQEYQGGVTQREGVLTRAASEKQNYFNQILDYAMKSGTLSQQDAQFYAQLISGENQATMDRQAAYDRAMLEAQTKKDMGEKDVLDYLGQASSIYSNVVGGKRKTAGT